MDDDTTSVTAALFGLAGFEVLAAADAGVQGWNRRICTRRLRPSRALAELVS